MRRDPKIIRAILDAFEYADLIGTNDQWRIDDRAIRTSVCKGLQIEWPCYEYHLALLKDRKLVVPIGGNGLGNGLRLSNDGHDHLDHSRESERLSF